MGWGVREGRIGWCCCIVLCGCLFWIVIRRVRGSMSNIGKIGIIRVIRFFSVFCSMTVLSIYWQSASSDIQLCTSLSMKFDIQEDLMILGSCTECDDQDMFLWILFYYNLHMHKLTYSSYNLVILWLYTSNVVDGLLLKNIFGTGNLGCGPGNHSICMLCQSTLIGILFIFCYR